MTIAGESFYFNDGILGMAISKAPLKQTDSDRSLIFHAFASGTENSVPLSILNNSTVWETNVAAFPDSFRVIGSRGVQTGGKWLRLNALNAFNEFLN